MIRVLIADDHPIVRQGLRAVIATDPEITVVDEAASVDEAIARLDSHDAKGEPVDVVTMDLRFGPSDGGVIGTKRIRTRQPAPAVLVITNYEDDADIVGAIEAGASGYLLKDAPPAELLEAIHLAAAGRTVLAPRVSMRLVEHLRAPSVQLTARERDVLELIAEGLSNQDIGQRLHLSQTTVKSHLARLYGKLDVPSRTAAVARARSLGLLP